MKTYKELRNAITIPIKVGDTVLGGKFKNKRITVKDIGKNEKGDITINGRPLLKYRLKPQDEVAPPGWEDTVKAMKKHKEIDNPWALAWYMKNKGYKSHEAHQVIKSGKVERIGSVDVVTSEDAPANSTTGVAIRPTILFKPVLRRKKKVTEMKTFKEIRNTELDEAASRKEAEKLVDYIRNDGKLSRQSDSIGDSVRKKFTDLRAMSKSSAKLPKFWMPVVVTAVKEYFNKETRLLAAEILVDDFIDFEIHQRQ